MEMVNIHTHTPGQGINVLDVSGNDRLISGQPCSMGIHPMYIDNTAGQRLVMIENAAKENRISGIGESGLDRNSKTRLDEQIQLFERQVEIAEKYRLPLIIHCVRAFPELISIRKKYVSSQAWIVHGYNNNRQILQELLRHGFYISAGKNVMNESSNIFELLPEIPRERLFLENDDSDYDIREIYDVVAKRLQTNIDILECIVYHNFINLFRC